ncbi:hypothetical protein [Helicobacter rodentium]|nr:hypothetical protein [Helicobacter rodentium]
MCKIMDCHDFLRSLAMTERLTTASLRDSALTESWRVLRKQTHPL